MRISDWSSDVCSSDLSFSALTRAQPQGPDLDTAIRDSLARLIAAVEAQPDSLVAALEAPEGWQKLNAIRVEARQLLELLRGPLSEVLGLHMGFNSFARDRTAERWVGEEGCSAGWHWGVWEESLKKKGI